MILRRGGLNRLLSTTTNASSSSSSSNHWGLTTGILSAAGVVSGLAMIYMKLESARDLTSVSSAPIYEGNPIVYFDVTDGEEPMGRLVFQLRADVVPRSAENVRILAIGALGWGYRNSPFHAIDKSRRIFGGDFFGGGAAGHSIYGETFNDESFAIAHTRPGILGMTSSAPNGNNSQFYITMKRMPELDGKNVAVGECIEGLEVLHALDAAALISGGRFGKGHDFRIRACGELKNWRPERIREKRLV